MLDFLPQVQEYLKMTGQSEQELMSGAQQYGAKFIVDKLVPKALKEKKRIVWSADPHSDPQLMLLVYRLERI